MSENIVRNIPGTLVRMGGENGRHFIAPVPSERECPGRDFQIIAVPVGGAQNSTFLCLRCKRELEGIHLPADESKIHRSFGQIP